MAEALLSTALERLHQLRGALAPAEAIVRQLVADLPPAWQSPAAIFLALAGALLAIRLLRFALAALHFVWAYFLRPGRNLKRYGPWAVVTGATDGIGKEYAKALAKKGLNVVLVSRTESKLAAVARELQASYGIKTRVCAADLTRGDEATATKVAATVADLEVGLLINNAGMSYSHAEYLDALDEGELRGIVNINALALTQLCKVVLPGMKERRRGVIVNIGSGASTAIPSSPLTSAYAATKAYVEELSRSLDAEYREFGVRIQNQYPMFVATKMSRIRRARLDAPTPAAWARSAVRQIGYEASWTPYWFHGLQVAVIRAAPKWVVAGQVMRLHKALRRAYYRKQARLQAEAAGQAEPKKAR